MYTSILTKEFHELELTILIKYDWTQTIKNVHLNVMLGN